MVGAIPMVAFKENNMSGISHTEANIGKSGRPCLECGKPHTLHWDPMRPKLLTWAADDGHFYKEMPFDTWLAGRVLELETVLKDIEHWASEIVARINLVLDKDK
jgi:hypothetical protein